MDINESQIGWQLRQISRRIWFRATFFALWSVAAALIALVVGPLMPADFAARLGADSVGSILEILASSMLIVATFSLSTVISAYAAASSATTPRATELLMQDPTAQNALSTFVGAFLFSLVGIIGLESGVYGDEGRIVLFALTIALVIVIVATFLRWVEVLSNFGRVPDAIERTARAASNAVRGLIETPCLGGRPAEDAPGTRHELVIDKLGYVRFIDMAALQNVAREAGGEIVVAAPPGAFLGGNRPVTRATFEFDEKRGEKIRAAFDVGDSRTFDQDPPYGISALAEIGIKALSPGINDPETASRVIDRLVRVLSDWGNASRDVAPKYDRVFAPPLDAQDLFAVAFAQIALYGAKDVRVGIRLQEGFAMLMQVTDEHCAEAARAQAKRALALAREALTLDVDRELLERRAANG